MACSGVYELRHIASNTAYVGSSANVKKRKYQHLWEMSKNRHRNYRLQTAYNASSGNSAFQFSVLEYCEPEQLKVVEQRYLDRQEFGFNISMKVEGRASPLSIEARVRLSAANTGKAVSAETKRRISEALRGRYFSAETRLKISEAGKGELSSRFIGYYHTPFGVYSSSLQAESACEGLLSKGSISRICRNPDKIITKLAYAKSRYLQTHHDASAIGMKWVDLGFSLTPVTRG
ncbi:GIY-YIG catalytic domain protein [Sinorhizobium sp. KGO-5]|nr:GIY-YIG catalytic domain protein [Sinorhizobium sp. KGO-5]